jgi:outer membrane protein assembly factor BamD (BamD/ComL family)
MKRLVLLLLLLAPLARAEEPGQKDFEAATAREGRGDYAGAAAALEKLAQEQPQSTYADDALFEAAVVAEEHLSDPARAARLYDQLAKQYPTSRLARRARTRADFLLSSLKTGEAPLREYENILHEYARRPPSESLARMDKLLREHPDFALADRALYWMGTTEAEQQHDDRAIARFLEVEQRFPASEWAGRAKKARADILLRTGHAAEARRVYEELGRSTDLLARAASQEGLTAVRSSVHRVIVLWVAIAYFALFLSGNLVILRRLHAGFTVPTEVWFYLPVALVFVAAAATENGAIALATAGIALGGGIVVWLVCALLRARPGHWPARISELAASTLAVVSVMYIAVQTTGLTDLVLETLRSGPER